jgi:NAD(P)-dependent dehydrogenase (short-subunit alcohol dehydrogenase family)
VQDQHTREGSRAVAVITGATGGIGREIALGLARAGRHVVLIGRDAGRGAAVQAEISRQVPDASTEFVLADLSRLSETRAAAAKVLERHPRIAILVNNAGVFEAEAATTAEGFERVLATNLLSPIALTEALLPALKAGAPARVVNIGSSSSDRASIDPDDLVLGRRWSMVRAYSQSKLGLMMASFALARQLAGSGVVVNVVHPGLVATGLVRTGGPIGLVWRILGRVALSEAEGADSPLHVALSPEFAEVSGVYVKRRRAVPPNPRALAPGAAERVLASVERLLDQAGVARP